jgi:hypothetical protein
MQRSKQQEEKWGIIIVRMISSVSLQFFTFAAGRN